MTTSASAQDFAQYLAQGLAQGSAPDKPGDDAPSGTPGTGEDVCPMCKGSGTAPDGAPCPHCQGSGKVNKGIGGA